MSGWDIFFSFVGLFPIGTWGGWVWFHTSGWAAEGSWEGLAWKTGKKHKWDKTPHNQQCSHVSVYVLKKEKESEPLEGEYRHRVCYCRLGWWFSAGSQPAASDSVDTQSSPLCCHGPHQASRVQQRQSQLKQWAHGSSTRQQTERVFLHTSLLYIE